MLNCFFTFDAKKTDLVLDYEDVSNKCLLQVFPTTGLRHRMLVGGSLEFTAVRLEDAGTYVCTASNDAGSVSREITLDVQGKGHSCSGRIRFLSQCNWPRYILVFSL